MCSSDLKSDAEVRLMRKAAALTDAAMAAIRDTLADGKPHTERELALLADRAMLAGGADRTAFDSVRILMTHSSVMRVPMCLMAVLAMTRLLVVQALTF